MAVGNVVAVEHDGQTLENALNPLIPTKVGIHTVISDHGVGPGLRRGERRGKGLSSQRLKLLQPFSLPLAVVRDLAVAHLLPVDDVVAIAAPRVEHGRVITDARRQDLGGEREALAADLDRLTPLLGERVGHLGRLAAQPGARFLRTHERE